MLKWQNQGDLPSNLGSISLEIIVKRDIQKIMSLTKQHLEHHIKNQQC